jgi:WD40 repeat protein
LQSRKGTYVAFLTEKLGAKRLTFNILERATGKILLRRETNGFDSHIAFSPDEAFLAFGLGSDSDFKSIIIWDCNRRCEHLCLNGISRYGCSDIQFSGNAQFLAVNCCDWTDGAVRVWDVATGKELVPIKDPGGPVRHMALNAHGDRLLTISYKTGSFGRPFITERENQIPDTIRAAIYDLPTGKRLVQTDHQAASFVVVPNEDRGFPMLILQTAAEQPMFLVNPVTAEVVGELDNALHLSFPDWPFNLARHFDSNTIQINGILTVAGYPPRSPFREWLNARIPAIASSLSETPQTVSFYDATTARLLCRLDGVHDLVASCDSKLLATYCSKDQTISIWDIPPRKPVGWFLAIAAGMAGLWAAVVWRSSRRRRRLAGTT